MKQNIITDLNILRKKSEHVTDIQEAEHIIKDLEDSLDINRGCGLSAIQIGINKNVAIVRTDSIKINLINAYIVEKSGKFRMEKEGCLSLPCLKIDTIRYNKIIVNNNGETKEYIGMIAIIIQHELAHCKGRTILDDKWRAR
jgi:peptide deformylase